MSFLYAEFVLQIERMIHMKITEGMTFKNLRELLVVLDLPPYQGGFQKTLRWNKANKILSEMGLTIKTIEGSHKLKIVKIEE